MKPEDFRDAANKLVKNSEYAKKTGMDGKKFEVKRFSTKEEIYEYVEKGGVVRVYTTQYVGGHYIVIKGINKDKNGKVIGIITDDNLNPGIHDFFNLNKIQLSIRDIKRQAWTLIKK